MRKSLKTGLSFGLTTGVITTLGLMVGLNAGTHSKLAVIGGVLTIAIADAFSDALGVHISEEYAEKTPREVWEATFATLASKLVFASTFVVPVILLELSAAVVISVAWGLLLLAAFSYHLAKRQGRSAALVVGEHVAIALIVIVLTHFTGEWIAQYFG